MTVGKVNNWVDLGVTGRVDVDALTVADLVTALIAAGVLTA